jgi:predicted TIM-barrel fold metal-dependent hydrolase
VFDRFPGLRIFFAEAEASWVPFVAGTADFRYGRHIYWAEELMGQRRLQRLPSEYIREHFYWGIVYDAAAPQMRHLIGADRIIWSTDFPHQDTEWPHSRAAIDRMFAGIPEEDTYRMVAGNVIDFLHLESQKPKPAPEASAARSR